MKTPLITSELDIEAVAVEVARNEAGARLPISELLSQIGVPEDYFLNLSKDPVFKRKVKKLKKQIEDDGVSFQMKSHISAEASIPTVHRLVNHPDTPPMAVLKGMELLVRWANLEPKPSQEQHGTGFSLNINLGSSDQNIQITANAPAKQELPAIDADYEKVDSEGLWD